VGGQEEAVHGHDRARARAQRPGDDIAPRARAGLAQGEAAGVDELLDLGMIAGEQIA